MQDYHTWRELLADLIKKSRDRKRIATAVKVDTETLLAWAQNASTPNVQQLHALLAAIPHRQILLRTLIAEEFEGFDVVSNASAQDAALLAFSARVLDLYANAPETARSWSICTAVISEAVKQLDPDHLGISLSIVQCMPSYMETVYCLREYIGLGTFPWIEQVEVGTRFLGAESLAGQAVSSGMPQIVDDMRQGVRPSINMPEHTVSAAAFPITHSKRIAGCFLLASTQADYFSSPMRQELIEHYKAMLALAFSPDAFYGQEQVALQMMPTFQVQQPYLSTLQQRVVATLKTAFNANHAISYLEAQQHVYGQIAEELLRLQPQPGL